MEKKMSNRKYITFVQAAAIVLCLALLLTCLAFVVGGSSYASAEPAVTQVITVSDAQVHRGEEFTVDVVLSGNESTMLSLCLEITFDRSAMTLTDVYRPGQKSSEIASGWALPSAEYTPSGSDYGYSMYGSEKRPFRIILLSAQGATGNGKVVTLTFTASPTATILDEDSYTDYKVNVTCDKKNTRVRIGEDYFIPTVGGDVGITYGKYWVKLKYDKEQDGEAIDATKIYDNNVGMKSLQDIAYGIVPFKKDTLEYTYEFRGWKFVEVESTSNHHVFEPTFDAIPVPYDLTLNIAIEDHGVLDFESEDLALFVGEGYLDEDAVVKTVTRGFGEILLFDAYKPAIRSEYTFVGWFTDETCLEPVTIATMPVGGAVLYGYYKENISEDFTDETTWTKLGVSVNVPGDGYVYATVNVTENFIFNALRFALDFDADALTLLSFRVGPDSTFYGELAPVFPAVNEAIASGKADSSAWQDVDPSYDLEKLVFLFISTVSNTTAKGDLITFKFAVKDEAKANTDISIKLTDRAMTRMETVNRVWYVGAAATKGTLRIVRADKPTETVGKTYAYTGQPITYAYASAGGTDYYTVDGNIQTVVDTYPVAATLISASDLYLTWKDLSIDPVVYDFVIVPRPVLMPVAFEDADTRYTYTGSEVYYAFADSGEVAYYQWSGYEKTSAGTYTVQVWLLDKENTCWDNEGKTTDDLTFDFIINKQVILSPVIPSKKYTGTRLTADISSTDLYTVTKNEGGIKLGSYEVILTLTEKAQKNYRWDVTKNAENLLYFNIVQNQNYWEISPHVVDKYYDGEPIKTSAARAAIGSIEAIITFYDAQGNELAAAPSDAGFYSVRFFVPTKEYAEGIMEVWTFRIHKIVMTVPQPTERIYIYNGEMQTFLFDVAGDTDHYTLSSEQYATYPGVYTVTATIDDTTNYIWEGEYAGVASVSWKFEIRYDAIRAKTSDDYVVTLSAKDGFPTTYTMSALSDVVDVAATLDALIAADETLGRKCLIASFDIGVKNGDNAVTYTDVALTYDIQYIRTSLEGYAIVYLDGDTFVLMEHEATAENVFRFTTDKTGIFLLLADHVFDQEVTDEAYLISEADCEHAALYYKSCLCGMSSEDYDIEDKTFSVGEPNGHTYNYEQIEWIWAKDASSCVAKVTCSVDGDVKEYQATIALTASVLPKPTSSGSMTYTASFEEGEKEYTDTFTVSVPTNGHEYNGNPNWKWKESGSTFEVTATFICDCGESVVTENATVIAKAIDDKYVFTAKVVFNAQEYVNEKSIDLPVVTFKDGENRTEIVCIPGDKVAFFDAAARDDATFIGWKSTLGVLIAKNDEGEYYDYYVGLRSITFVSQWKYYAELNVTAKDEAGRLVENAAISIYNGDESIASKLTDANGNAKFVKLPYGNYKLVADYTDASGNVITRAQSLDIETGKISATVVFPVIRFSTAVEGEGSADGLENVISDKEKQSISEGTTAGTVNEIKITQKRTYAVGTEIKAEMQAVLHGELGNAIDFVEFLDVSLIKTTLKRNALGTVYELKETLSVSEGFQTNVFPISATLRTEIVRVSGTTENIFVFKRHTSEKGTDVYRLPKVTEAEGEAAEYECFFIKRVAGVDYIAVRQNEYSVFGFGVSAAEVLLANEITSLTISDWTYGSAAKTPIIESKYGRAKVIYTYGTSLDGPFTAEVPTDAGKYYVKAYIPAYLAYESAEKVTSFMIAKKMVVKPEADESRHVYNGTLQSYDLVKSNAYTITGDEQINAGNYLVTVALVSTDNYVWADGTNIPVSFQFVIEKKKLADLKGVTFEDQDFYFNFFSHSIYVKGDLPSDVKVRYEGNDQTDFGRYYVKAIFVTDNENYDLAEPIIAVMNVRINWIFVIVVAAAILLLIILILVFVEKAIKEFKKDSGDGSGKNNGASAQEGGSNE